MFPTGYACLKGGKVTFYSNAMLTPVKKHLEENTDGALISILGWRKRRKGQKGGKNLENGPYSSLQTKGISEAADLFTAALIWPQDKIKAIRQIKSSQDKALKQIVKGTKKLDLQKLMLLDQHNLDIYHQGHSQIARLHPLPGSRGSFAEQVPSPQFAHIK